MHALYFLFSAVFTGDLDASRRPSAHAKHTEDAGLIQVEYV